MASTEKLLRIKLVLVDEMSKEIDKASDSLSKVSKNLTNIGSQMTVGITAPIVAAGAAMFKTFADFDKVMAELGARTGATAEEMEKMRKFALQMGRDTAFSATQAAEALLELTASGASAADAMEMLPQVLNLAAAGALELGQAADAVTDIMAQFQVGIADTQTVVDILTQAAGASSATVEDLIQAFNNAGPVLHQFGLSVEESAAAMAVLAENGIKGAEAGTQLKSMMLNMSRDTEAVSSAWAKLGVSMFDAQGNMRGIDAIFKDINAAMEGMSTEEQIRLSQTLAGSYGIVGFNALRASNGISSMMEQMLNAAGAEQVAQARMNTLAGAYEQLMGSLETLGVVMGGLAEGPMVWFLQALTGIINGFAEWAEANPMLAQTVMIILALVAAIGPLLLIIGQFMGAIVAIKTAMPVVAAAFAGLKVAVIGFGATALAALAPFIPLILAIVAASALLWAVATNFMGIRDKIGEAVRGIVDFLSNLAGAWGEMIKKAGTSLSQLGTIIWEALKGLGKAAWELGVAIIEGLLKGIAAKAVELITFIFKLSQDLTNAVKDALGIASPSKVMMSLGENVVKGFHEGIEGMGGIGVTVPKSNAMPMVSGDSASFAGAMGGGGNVYIQTLNVPAGTSKEQVDYIMKEVGKASSRRGAKKTRR